ncbi:hypothetical protein EPUS_03657 [Endocarpon pusillum Z07020]|uniref:Uncharacterized protein n=1 Tax=Endocarpon pusillum (strain Z07020 / HMAS-L-300199) TaxID=1263415 RepID=U1HHP3_ENDPU|nr:uncharacterized protein EPUS_03657 [Endocarpon pusillum Z07020]ERF69665.1 hypothetical protein EPUS_03657 [Endocarpon pusillum Z07020]
MYGYFTNGSQFENSPEELAKYRQEYLRVVKALGSNNDGTGPEEVDVTLTRQSLVMKSICIAAGNFVSTWPIVGKVFKEIARLVGPEAYQETEGKIPKQGGGKEDLDAPQNPAHGKNKAGDEVQEEAEGANSGLESDSEESFIWKDDMGEFRLWLIAHTLVDDSLDEQRKALLKEGFDRLLARG